MSLYRTKDPPGNVDDGNIIDIYRTRPESAPEAIELDNGSDALVNQGSEHKEESALQDQGADYGEDGTLDDEGAFSDSKDNR
jgi:hypothetical protein